jgi:2-methylcitrate dehydratase PrpD
MTDHPSLALATFASTLRFEDIPAPVLRRAEDLLLDWIGSALAGKPGRPVQAIASFAHKMGPESGPCEVLISRRATSPLFAAMVNAASSHYAEQDDVHNGSVFHPAAVVFPAALALAQANRASGRDLLTAAVVGYEVGIRVGEFLGRSHYRIFHTTGTAGTVAAAAAAGRLLNLTPEQMLHAFGSAGTQAAGLWEFLRDAADSKQLHTAKAAGDGLMSDRLGERWALAETSFKFHSSCRHTHPAADALLQVVSAQQLRPEQIARVTAHVHQGALDVLGPVVDPQTVHQAKFSMGTVLGLIAQFGSAGLTEFDSAYQDPRIAAFRDKVVMRLDQEVDTAYPARWIGKVTVETLDGRSFDGRVDEPKGDPGNTLSREELERKALRLAQFGDAASEAEMRAVFARVWTIADCAVVGKLLG